MNNSDLNTIFGDTADSIREKLGTQSGIKPENFAEEISKISGGTTKSDIYKVESVDDLDNLDAELGDIGVVTKIEESPLSNSFTGGTINLVKKVIFDSPIEGEFYGTIYANTAYLDIQLNSNSAYVMYNNQDSGEQIDISYTSEDGITYITEDELVPLIFSDVMFAEFDEYTSKFGTCNTTNFSGIYELKEEKVKRIVDINGNDLGIYDPPFTGQYVTGNVGFAFNFKYTNNYITDVDWYFVSSGNRDIKFYYKDNSIYAYNGDSNNIPWYKAKYFVNADWQYQGNITPGESIKILSNIDNLDSIAFMGLYDEYPEGRLFYLYTDESMEEVASESYKFMSRPENIWSYYNIGSILESPINLYQGNRVYTNNGFVDGTLDSRTNIYSSGKWLPVGETPDYSANEGDLCFVHSESSGHGGDINKIFISSPGKNIFEYTDKQQYKYPTNVPTDCHWCYFDGAIGYFGTYDSPKKLIKYNYFTGERETLVSGLSGTPQIVQVSNFIYYSIKYGTGLYRYNLNTKETTLLNNEQMGSPIVYYEKENQIIWVTNDKLIRFSLDTNTVVSSSEEFKPKEKNGISASPFYAGRSYIGDKYVIWGYNSLFLTNLEDGTWSNLETTSGAYSTYVDTENNTFYSIGNTGIQKYSYLIDSNENITTTFLGGINFPGNQTSFVDNNVVYSIGNGYQITGCISLDDVEPYNMETRGDSDGTIIFMDDSSNDHFGVLFRTSWSNVLSCNIRGASLGCYKAGKIYRYSNNQWNLLIDNTKSE